MSRIRELANYDVAFQKIPEAVHSKGKLVLECPKQRDAQRVRLAWYGFTRAMKREIEKNGEGRDSWEAKLALAGEIEAIIQGEGEKWKLIFQKRWEGETWDTLRDSVKL